MRTIENEKGFWARVSKPTPTGCWLWKGELWRGGYGLFVSGGKSRAAHRVSYYLAKGRIPWGKVIRHTCDERRCVQPRHLIIGSYQENTQDMFDRGRARGPGGVVKKLNTTTRSLTCSYYLPRKEKDKISRLAARWGIPVGKAVSLLIQTVGERMPGSGVLVPAIPRRK